MGNVACIAEEELLEELLLDEENPTPRQNSELSWMNIPNANLRKLGLRTSEVSIDKDHLDPTTSPLKATILSKLGMPGEVPINSLTTDQNGAQICHGFNNAGIWTIMDETGIANLVMKLVRPELEEGSRFQKLATQFPFIVWDPLLAFPLQVIRCISPQSRRPREFIIMPKASGAVLHDLVVHKVQKGALQELLPVFGTLGACLAKFHLQYGNKQHGDFQPSNVVYNKDSNEITFIDIADMGSPLSPPGSDIKQFQASLQALYGHLGNNVAASLLQPFMNGYQSLRPY